MLVMKELRLELEGFFRKIRLVSDENNMVTDKAKKIRQILAYLEVIRCQVRKYSRKRELVFIDGCAGNCHLSFLVYHYFANIEERPVRIHCVDYNSRLRAKNAERARELGFDNIHFHGCDVGEFEPEGRVDAVYSLHACDDATDKVMALAVNCGARNILSVSCCQHIVKKQIRTNPVTSPLSRHSVFKDRLAYMVGDTMRALLLEMNGYEADAIEFVTATATEKNIMIRARVGQPKPQAVLIPEYEGLKRSFRVTPALEELLGYQKSKMVEHKGTLRSLFLMSSEPKQLSESYCRDS